MRGVVPADERTAFLFLVAFLTGIDVGVVQSPVGRRLSNARALSDRKATRGAGVCRANHCLRGEAVPFAHGKAALILDRDDSKRDVSAMDAESVAQQRSHDVVRQASAVGEPPGLKWCSDCHNEKMRSLHFAWILGDDQRPALMSRDCSKIAVDVEKEGSRLFRRDSSNEFHIDEFLDLSFEPSAFRTPKVREGLIIIYLSYTDRGRLAKARSSPRAQGGQAPQPR